MSIVLFGVHDFVIIRERFVIAFPPQFCQHRSYYNRRVTMWDIEITDTFGGEANYCWVHRETVNLPESRRSIVRAVKKMAGWTGLRATVSDMGDIIEIRPAGICQVAFATWHDCGETPCTHGG